MSQKQLAHIRTVMDVRIDQSGDDDLAPGVHYLRTGFQDRRSFSSAPYSADDVAFNQNTDVSDWCLARSIYQGCALNQKIFGIRVRQSQHENRNHRQTHRLDSRFHFERPAQKISGTRNVSTELSRLSLAIMLLFFTSSVTPRGICKIPLGPPIVHNGGPSLLFS